MEIILNELSLTVSDVPLPARLNALRSVVDALGRCGVEGKAIRCTRDALQRHVSPGQPLFEGLKSSGRADRDRELKQWLQSKLSRAPFVEDLYGPHEVEGAVVFRWRSEIALGAGLAILQRSTLVSLFGTVAFDADILMIEEERLTLAEAVDVRTHEVENFAEVAHVEGRREALERRIAGAIRSGAQLVREAEQRFSRVILCEGARKQLEQLSGAEIYFSEVCRHLRVLHEAALNWCPGAPFDPRSVEAIDWARTESESTIDQFGEQRDFLCPDGIKRRFLPHTKIRRGNQRIHVLLETKKGEMRVLIGYVGTHLDIASEN